MVIFALLVAYLSLCNGAFLGAFQDKRWSPSERHWLEEDSVVSFFVALKYRSTEAMKQEFLAVSDPTNRFTIFLCIYNCHIIDF
jgi:hypothetical protein